MDSASTYEVNHLQKDNGKKSVRHRKSRNFSRLHRAISNFKMPGQVGGYIRPKKHEHY